MTKPQEPNLTCSICSRRFVDDSLRTPLGNGGYTYIAPGCSTACKNKIREARLRKARQ